MVGCICSISISMFQLTKEKLYCEIGQWGGVVGLGVYAPSPSMFELRKKKLYCEMVKGMGVVGVVWRGWVVGVGVYAPSPSPCSN